MEEKPKLEIGLALPDVWDGKIKIQVGESLGKNEKERWSYTSGAQL